MKLLMHGIELCRQFLVDPGPGELVPVTAKNARSAFYMVMCGRENKAEEWPPRQPMVYELDDHGELIAVYD